MADIHGTRYSRMLDLGRRAQRTARAQLREAEAEDEASGDYCYVEGRRWDLVKHGQYRYQGEAGRGTYRQLRKQPEQRLRGQPQSAFEQPGAAKGG